MRRRRLPPPSCRGRVCFFIRNGGKVEGAKNVVLVVTPLVHSRSRPLPPAGGRRPPLRRRSLSPTRTSRVTATDRAHPRAGNTVCYSPARETRRDKAAVHSGAPSRPFFLHSPRWSGALDRLHLIGMWHWWGGVEAGPCVDSGFCFRRPSTFFPTKTPSRTTQHVRLLHRHRARRHAGGHADHGERRAEPGG